MPRTQLPGTVIGTPGGSLEGATWAHSDAAARTGARGEERTAALLDALARKPGGPTVLHDLEIRQGRAVYNIDHVVVSGKNVYLIDAKVWKPGRYLTWRGKTFGPKRPVDYSNPNGRQTRRAAHADKKTMGLARAHIEGLGVKVSGSVLAVWPSSTRGVIDVRFARNVSAKVMNAESAVAWVARRATRPANPDVVNRLMPMVVALAKPKNAPRPGPRNSNYEDWAA